MLLAHRIDQSRLGRLMRGYGLELQWTAPAQSIPGSFWGDPEAGLIGSTVHARADTPLHSVLHEVAHYICMAPERRAHLHTNAEGDDAEEAAVCYLQILLGDWLLTGARERLFNDMDAWGYSFRLGTASRWFAQDAEDAKGWLMQRGIIDADAAPTFALAGMGRV